MHVGHRKVWVQLERGGKCLLRVGPVLMLRTDGAEFIPPFRTLGITRYGVLHVRSCRRKLLRCRQRSRVGSKNIRWQFMLVNTRCGLQLCKPWQRFGCLTALLVGESQVQLSAAVAGLNSQRFFQFANSFACAFKSYKNGTQSAVSLFGRRCQTDDFLEISERSIQIVVG